MSKRPEHHAASAIDFYNDQEADNYVVSTRMATVQTALAQRCFDLLNLPRDGCPRLLLDIGCGTGLSGAVLSDAGHHWLGADISRPMLHRALDADAEGDLALADMGQGVALRTGVCDGAVSVSALQWLIWDSTRGGTGYASAHRRLANFFAALYRALARSARAALQFYPASSHDVDLVTAAAMRAGFSGGLLVDFPNSTRAKKYFLVLTAGPPAKGASAAPTPLGVGDDGIRGAVQNTSRGAGRRGRREAVQSRRDLVVEMKERKRRQGHGQVRPDSKYTGRRRRTKF